MKYIFYIFYRTYIKQKKAYIIHMIYVCVYIYIIDEGKAKFT